MAEFIQVSTTTASREDADRIANRVVEKRLAACAQIIGPIASTYWWKGEIETAEEWLCLMKSRMDRFDEVKAKIIESHPYDTPEIIAMPIVAGSEGYMAWLAEELAEGG